VTSGARTTTLAGLDDLPDTIMSRAVVVRMRRRAPGERIEPWRRRINQPQAEPLFDRLQAWAETVAEQVTGAWPTMPPEVEDRDADLWEALLAVADAAGGTWPQRARAAAVALVQSSKDRAPSLGVLLLADVRTAFTGAATDRISTSDLLDALHKVPESPWANLRGKELDARGLARRLTSYEIRSTQVWIDGKNVRGYEDSSFFDAWIRSLPAPDDADDATDDAPVPPDASARSARNARTSDDDHGFLAGLADLADATGAKPTPRTDCTDCQREQVFGTPCRVHSTDKEGTR